MHMARHAQILGRGHRPRGRSSVASGRPSASTRRPQPVRRCCQATIVPASAVPSRTPKMIQPQGPVLVEAVSVDRLTSPGCSVSTGGCLRSKVGQDLGVGSVSGWSCLIGVVSIGVVSVSAVVDLARQRGRERRLRRPAGCRRQRSASARLQPVPGSTPATAASASRETNAGCPADRRPDNRDGEIGLPTFAAPARGMTSTTSTAPAVS